jgi:hypothetical protein
MNESTPDHQIEMSEEEIRSQFKILTLRPITNRTISVAKCIAKVAQWHLVEILKLGLMPVRVGNYYLVKAEVVDELFSKLDKQGIPQHITEVSDMPKSPSTGQPKETGN